MPETTAAARAHPKNTEEREADKILKFKTAVMKYFNKLDIDSDGFLVKEEIRKGMKGAKAEKMAAYYLRDLDVNHDGFIEPDEWIRWFMAVLDRNGGDSESILKELRMVFRNLRDSTELC